MSQRIEVQCGWCGERHDVETLAAPLLCCSVSYGVRRLIAEVENPKTGQRWFEVTNGTVVRIYTR